MLFSDYRLKYCPDTERITGAYVVIYQGGKIDHCTHIPYSVAQYSAESDYNPTCTEGMALSRFSIMNN